jgi:hypothetical protein
MRPLFSSLTAVGLFLTAISGAGGPIVSLAATLGFSAIFAATIIRSY